MVVLIRMAANIDSYPTWLNSGPGNETKRLTTMLFTKVIGIGIRVSARAKGLFVPWWMMLVLNITLDAKLQNWV